MRYLILIVSLCAGCGEPLSELIAKRNELAEKAAALDRRIESMYDSRKPREEIEAKKLLLAAIRDKLGKVQEKVDQIVFE